MARTKNKKGAVSDRVHLKKEPKKMNPFEMHINKEKLRVLGKKQKSDRGLPGVSRAKAIQKRKHTLLEEFKVQNKSNTFLDKRIGEKANMDSEDKALARYTALKIKSHNKKSIFNLADDEVLTHKGQTLSEIEKFDDPRSDDEDDLFDNEYKTGNLDTNFVKEAHFGGGILRNTGKEGAMTHKDLINQLIVESKIRKAEKQKIKEATLELTEKLDSDWKDLIPLVTKDAKSKEEEIKKQKVDDYDKVMRELRFEKRGGVSDRLKTEEEMAKEEKESLEKLEEERIKRMYKDDREDKPKPKHRSADDLDDDFVYDDVSDEEEKMLSYNQEGISNNEVSADINGMIIKAKGGTLEDQESEQDEENQEQAEESSDEDQALETDSEDNLSDLKESDTESEEEEQKKPEENEKGDEIEEIEEEKEIAEVEASDEEREEEKEIAEVEASDEDKEEEKEIAEESSDEESSDNEEIESEPESHEKVVDKNKNVMREDVTEKLEIPFTFNLPDSYETLLKTLEEYEDHQHTVIERMIKCNHPSLSEQNKEKLGLLFAYTMQYINDLFSENLDSVTIKKHFKIYQLLVPQIYSLAQLNSENIHKSVQEVIKEKFDEYKKRPKNYPGIEVLAFLKLVSILFPTSDYRHQVVTPCYVFMELMLTKCRVQTRRDISYGLFLSTLVLEYSALSKRYLPAVINYLSGLLHMAIPKLGVRLIKIPPPFKATSTHLVLVENCNLELINSLKLCSSDLCEAEFSPKYQIRILHNTVKLLQQFLEQYKILSSHVEIFERVLNYLQMIPLTNYPKIVKNNVKSFMEELKKCKDERRLEYLVLESSKPKALRLYEPKIQPVYDYKQHKVQSKEKAQLNKLLHKVKREKKGAVREIRRDNAFLGRIKINRQIQSDVERKEKVKRIYSEASIQQSELNAIDRKKKRKI